MQGDPTVPKSGGVQIPLTSASVGMQTPTVASVWALDRLSQGPFALLTVLSFLAPDCIEPQLFFSDTETETLIPVDIEGYPKNANDCYDARSELLESCMVQYEGSPDRDGSLRIPRLVQDVMILRCQELFDFPQIFSTVVRTVSRAWTYVFDSDGGTVRRAHHTARWPSCEMLFPHISSLHQRYINFAWEKQLPPKATKKFAHLLLEAGW